MSDGLLPFVVGITGHRDIPCDDEAPLRARFGEILERFGLGYPNTPIVVLSALAAGADVLAAQEALDHGIDVVACLPMPQAEYEHDFSPAELERFRSILARCSTASVVGSGDRETGYASVGNYIAYYGNVLVAFWDGLPGAGPGGTADVVRLRQTGLAGLNQDANDTLLHFVPDVGPVFHIVTPRANHPRPQNCYAIKELYPDRPYARATNAPGDSGQAEFARALTNVDRLNCDLKFVPFDDAVEPLTGLYRRIDAAANAIQKRSLRALQAIFIGAALAGVAQIAVPTGGLLHLPAMVWRVGFMAAALVVFLFAKRRDYENRYQDYRAISEALRVQIAWCHAGMRTQLVESSYLQMQRDELQWIRLALRNAFFISNAAQPRADDSPDHEDCRNWITGDQGQLGYYERAGRREERRARTARRWSLVAVVAGILISASAGAASAMFHGIDPRWPIAYLESVPITLGGLIALLLRFYGEQRGYAENARRYQKMFAAFDAANRRLRDHIGNPSDVLRELGHEALTEHADWLTLRRERPITFVHT